MKDYELKPKSVKAMQYKAGKKKCDIPSASETVAGRHIVHTRTGKHTLRNGEYVVQTEEGLVVIPEELFEATYIPIKKGKKVPPPEDPIIKPEPWPQPIPIPPQPPEETE